MLEEAVDPKGDGLLEVSTQQVPIHVVVGSDKNYELVNYYLDASSKNLQNEQPTIAMEALWEMNSGKILFYCLFNALPFVLFALTSIFFPDFAPLVLTTPGVNMLLVLNEFNEMRIRGKEYFYDFWNYLDLLGNSLSIYFGLGHIFCEDR